MQEKEGVTIRRNVCQVCYCDCGMLTYMKGGRVIKVEGDPDNPHNRGVLCAQGRSARQMLYNPDRLRYPMKRVGKRGGGEWERITWDEALDTIAGKLLEVKKKYGPEALAFVKGPTRQMIEQVFQRFCYAYGTPNYSGNWSYCVGPKMIGYTYTYGKTPQGIPYMPWSDFKNSKYIMLFGTNPALSFIHRYPRIMSDILDAKEAGAKLVVVDPRFTETASKADIYVPIKPGTDAALLLAMIRTIINEELHDDGFVKKYTIGFERLREHVQRYTPEYAEEITGVPAWRIVEIARQFAAAKPACLDRREGVLHHTNSTHTLRAMAILLAITGNIDKPGTLLFNPGNKLGNITRKERLKSKPIWAERFPLVEDATAIFAEAILTGKPHLIKAMMCTIANPIQEYPNTTKVREALDSLDLLVVDDLFMTETAKLADIVLPASTFFEKAELCKTQSLALTKYFQVSHKIMEPLFESLPDWKYICLLAKRMGLDGFDYADEDEIIDEIIKPLGVKVSDLGDSGVYSVPFEVGLLRRNGFNTPSGKIELYSEQMTKLGYDPLPSYVEPPETVKSRPDAAEKYPFTLITGSKTAVYHHSQQRNYTWLREYVPDPVAEINERTAARLGIREGDVVVVEGLRGEATMKAKLTNGILEDVVSVTHGWEGKANINYLTDDTQLDPIAAMPAFRTILCNVRRAEA
ncbi:MAG: molybdopterin-dependent oxidoreductase [Candidatus Bathyarchaeota archaeon]|nr:molybdopterin-dependent oxidoreductase [Candidatus Bathyarchaeota archaeon]